MKLRMSVCAIALVGATALVTREVVSQSVEATSKPPAKERGRAGHGETGPGEKDAGSDTESLVDVWVRYAMPAEHHRLLDKMAGEWTTAIKYRMTAESPVVESEGTCEREWILGGRFLLENFDGGNLGLPFQALAIYGYDAFEKKYTSVWVDTMCTAITTSQGICQDDCRRIHFSGRHGDPWTGVKRKSRGVTRFLNDTTHVLELHETGTDGKEFKILEIVYSKKQTG